ncbi:hypothetical protein [Brevundimonas sp.]|jgi:hypothetical protein|uniref:hypothetical protein n=1 Tax=Brevundimonas sp. TaxID=1871086 RepID=UPI0037847C9A
MAFNTAYDLAGFMVNTKAAAVYAAQESSLFLGGLMIPQIQVPAGSIAAQLPLMGAVTAQKLTSASHDADDFNALGITSTNKVITSNIYAARDVVRDLGGIDPNELGRVLGNAVSAAFDKDCVAAMSGLTSSADTGTLTVNAIFDAVAQIRGAGETGQLYGILGAAAAAELMKVVGSQAYAGSNAQNEALLNGFIGQIGGVRFYQSAFATAAVSGVTGFKGAIFGVDAFRIAMFKNVDLEVARRAAAVGNDIVASLHAGVGIVDAARGVKLVDAA